MEITKNPFNFSAVIYEIKENLSPVLTKARCRIFYKYANRNLTYITDDFADKLIKSLPYTPVKGIYDKINGDYIDHGKERDDGRIYGIVPQDPNHAWEKHLDVDGTERIYLCADVLLYTGLYKEAKEIVGKSLSMELYKPTSVYHSEIIDGIEYLVFDDGCFLGLQVLGDRIEPCFEGAEFFSLCYNVLKENLTGGKKEPMDIIFNTDKKDIYQQAWYNFNKDFSEHGVVDYSIVGISDNSITLNNLSTGGYQVFSYSIGDNNSYIFDNEGTTYDRCSVYTNENYDDYVKMTSDFEAIKEEKEKLSCELQEEKTANNNLLKEKEDIVQKYKALSEEFKKKESECAQLLEYKADKEMKEKEEVLAQYSLKLEKEVIDSFREKINEYTCDQLDRELAYTLVKLDPEILDSSAGQGRIPIDKNLGDIGAILNQYKK